MSVNMRVNNLLSALCSKSATLIILCVLTKLTLSINESSELSKSPQADGA